MFEIEAEDEDEEEELTPKVKFSNILQEEPYDEDEEVDPEPYVDLGPGCLIDNFLSTK